MKKRLSIFLLSLAALGILSGGLLAQEQVIKKKQKEVQK
jgi:hypothetical protein